MCEHPMATINIARNIVEVQVSSLGILVTGKRRHLRNRGLIHVITLLTPPMTRLPAVVIVLVPSENSDLCRVQVVSGYAQRICRRQQTGRRTRRIKMLMKLSSIAMASETASCFPWRACRRMV